jgi:carbon monoxide dehydrogenase subunit G
VSVAIHNGFAVRAEPDRTWALLTDIRRIAHCVPGAELTEVVDERTYKGRIGVRLGPVSLAFAGQVRFEEIDATVHRATIKATGTDTKGRGGAQAQVVCSLSPAGADTHVDIVTNLDLSGSIAQYGRATGMIAGVAQQLIDQFAAALEADMKASARPGAALDVPAPPPRQEISILRLVRHAFVAAISKWLRRLAKH